MTLRPDCRRCWLVLRARCVADSALTELSILAQDQNIKAQSPSFHQRTRLSRLQNLVAARARISQRPSIVSNGAK